MQLPELLKKDAAAAAPSKKKKSATKKKEASNAADELTILIVSLSAVVAARPGLSFWAISEKEAKSIADPLCRMLEKSAAGTKLAEHADALALIVAASSVILPRAMMQMSMQKPKNKEVKNHADQSRPAHDRNHSAAKQPASDSVPHAVDALTGF